MLVKERLRNCDFSRTEQGVVDYILKEGTAIEGMTVKEIAKASYAAPSTLVRIAHKMGFRGWNDLKEAFLKEEIYLQSHFQGLDANLPFRRTDNIMAIAGKLASLKKEAIDDTLELLGHDDLQKAVQIIRKASCIHIFGVSNNLLISQEFAHNMSRIQKNVRVHSLQSEIVFDAYAAEADCCALFISYTGETKILIRAARAVKARKIPLIMITGLGMNTIAGMSDCVLRISTREKQYSKIATFVNDESIIFLLDVLYACIFALAYDKNLQWKVDVAKIVELERSSTVNIIREK